MNLGQLVFALAASSVGDPSANLSAKPGNSGSPPHRLKVDLNIQRHAKIISPYAQAVLHITPDITCQVDECSGQDAAPFAMCYAARTLT